MRPKPQDQHRAPGNVVSRRREADVPIALAELAVVEEGALRERHHEEQGMLGDGDRVGRADDGKRHAGFRQRRHVHRIVADAVAGHDLQPGGIADDAAGERRHAQDRRVVVADMLLDVVLGELGEALDGNVVAPLEHRFEPCRIGHLQHHAIGHACSLLSCPPSRQSMIAEHYRPDLSSAMVRRRETGGNAPPHAGNVRGPGFDRALPSRFNGTVRPECPACPQRPASDS